MIKNEIGEENKDNLIKNDPIFFESLKWSLETISKYFIHRIGNELT